jgi:hypothetical protein
MAICGCGLPAHCCQPAVAGGFIYADLLGELSTHLVPQALFTQSSPVREPLLQAFPFPSTLGEVTLHPLSQASVFIYISHGKWAFPPSPVEFSSHCCFYKPFCSWLLGMCCCSCCWCVCLQLTWEVGLPPSPVEFSSLCHFYKLSCSRLLGVCHCSWLLRPELFIYSSVRDSPPPLFGAQGTPPSLLRVFIVLIAITQFLFFLSGWGLVCPGGYADLAQCCLWEYRIPLSSLCGPHLPKLSVHQSLVAPWGPPGFST